MSNIIPYTQTTTIYLKDGSEIDIPEDKATAVFDAWQNKEIINFGNKMIDSVMISKIESVGGKPDLKTLTLAGKSRFLRRCKEFKQNLDRKPTQTEEYNIYIKAKLIK